jgi:hypothetical protein
MLIGVLAMFFSLFRDRRLQNTDWRTIDGISTAVVAL